LTGFSHQTKPAVALEIDNVRAEKRCWLSRLRLQNFRNYPSAELSIGSGQMVILGDNGAGKTNLLEAVSLLAPGRGLRRAKAEQIVFSQPSTPLESRRTDWAVAATLQSDHGSVDLGTGIMPDSQGGGRVMRLEGSTVSQAEIGNYLAVSWITPQMDGIFIDAPAARRRFLDRLERQ